MKISNKKAKELGSLLTYKDGKTYINGKWAFYWESTMGIPKEVFEEWVNNELKKYV